MRKGILNCLVIVVFAMSATFMSCDQKENKETEETDVTGDSTPQEIMEIFDNYFKVIEVNLDSLKLKTTPQKGVTSDEELLKELKILIAYYQLFYTLSSEYATPNQPNGLAYVRGGKTDKIQDPPYSDNVCRDRLAGLDCSGLLYLGANKTGLTITKGEAFVQNNGPLTQEASWEKWLQKKYANITVEKTKISPPWNNNNWETGDIILFGNTHIGTICREFIYSGPIAIIHSQGDNKSCEYNKEYYRGPKFMTSKDNDPVNSWNLFTARNDISRIRFVLKYPTDMLGEWFFSISEFPCIGGGDISLKANGSAVFGGFYNGTWSIIGSSIIIKFLYDDSDEHLSMTLNGTINNNKNKITGSIVASYSDYNGGDSQCTFNNKTGTFIMEKR